MKLIALVLAAAVLAASAPVAAAAEDVPPFPPEYVTIARAWIADAREDLARDAGENWTRDVQPGLDRAEAYAAAGRLHAAAAEVIGARAALSFHRLWAEVGAMGSESAKRARVTAQADAWNAESSKEAKAFRDRLRALEGDLTSLLALEAALFAADWFTDAHFDQSVFPTFRKEINTDRFDASLVLGLVAVTDATAWKYRFASDLLGPSEAREGLAPKFKADKWRNLTMAAGYAPDPASSPPTTRPYDELSLSANATGEGVLSVASFLASIRANRISGVQTMFGDGAGRGLDAVRDLGENVNRSLADPPRTLYTDAGYEGLLAMNGVDVARYALDREDVSIATLARGWIAVEHARTMATVYAEISPVAKPATAGVEGNDALDGRLVTGLIVLGASAVAGGLIFVGRRFGR